LISGELFSQTHQAVKPAAGFAEEQGANGLLQGGEQLSDHLSSEAESLYYYNLPLQTFTDNADASLLGSHFPMHPRHLSSTALPLSYQTMPQSAVVYGQDWTGLAGANTVTVHSGIESLFKTPSPDITPEIDNSLILQKDVSESYQDDTHNQASHLDDGSDLTGFGSAGTDCGDGDFPSEYWSMQFAAASAWDWDALAMDHLACLDTSTSNEHSDRHVAGGSLFSFDAQRS